MRYIFLFLLIFLVTNLGARDILFGVVPQQSPLLLSKKWLPIAKELSKATGYNVIFNTEASIPLFEKALYSGKYDIAYMNPYHYVVAHKQAGFEAFVRSQKNIQGIIVAPLGKTMEDLKNSKEEAFLFPAPMAFAATLLVKYELKKKFGIEIQKQFTTRYVNSHDSVYKGVARGIGSYGGGIVRTYKNLEDTQTKQNIQIINHTQLYPSHPIALKKRLPAQVQTKIQEALLHLSPELLQTLNIKELIQVSNKDYESVKELAIELGIFE